MSDPVEEVDLGTTDTATEEVAAETEEIVETEDSADEIAVDAEGDDEEAAASGKGDVKYSRFKSVNERRKIAEAKAAALEAEVARLKPKEEVPQPKGLRERLKQDFVPAPSDMPALDQMQFYSLQAMEKHLPELMESWFESKFGTKPEAAAATLAHATTSTRETIIRQFNEAAAAHGLDAKDAKLRDAVGVLMDTGRFKTFADAMDVFKGATVKPQQRKPVNGNGAEVESVNLSGLVRAKNPILSKEQATALAGQGKRVEYKSVLEILGASQKGA